MAIIIAISLLLLLLGIISIKTKKLWSKHHCLATLAYFFLGMHTYIFIVLQFPTVHTFPEVTTIREYNIYTPDETPIMRTDGSYYYVQVLVEDETLDLKISAKNINLVITDEHSPTVMEYITLTELIYRTRHEMFAANPTRFPSDFPVTHSKYHYTIYLPSNVCIAQ